MKVIENYENVQASSGEFARPTAGGYICKIIDVEDVPMGADGKGDYLKIEYDIADGDFKGYYKDAFDKFGGNWWAKFVRSYKEKALGMFKHFTNCVEQSNPAYEWDWNEKGLIGKFIGLVLGEEEYKKQDGSIGTRLYVKDVKTVLEIQQGEFKVPELKRLPKEASSVEDFVPVAVDEALPF
jgi:hypothetical protein